MNIHHYRTRGIVIVSVSGVAGPAAAGALYDAMVEAAAGCEQDMILDLSGLVHLSRSAVRGILVAGRLLRNAGRQLRICRADASVEALLIGLGLSHIVHCDRSFGDALAALWERRAAAAPGGASLAVPRDLAEADAALRAEYARHLIDEGWRPASRVAEVCGYPSELDMRRALLCHAEPANTQTDRLAATGS
ncbi:STAS domain-containing protein [Rhodobacterales bacterium HKCCE2091]|nr:STAS domain-containing protein [Rhodobacterales bacterium HKCCE2091]